VTAHESFNALVRQAARGRAYVPRREPDVRHEGSIGVGRGGGSVPRALRPDPATRINEGIREAGWRVTHRVDAGGIDLDDLLGGR
jgi:hypothetical protein